MSPRSRKSRVVKRKSIKQRLIERVAVQKIRKLLEGKKEYLAYVAAASIAISSLLGVPIADDIDITDTQAVAGLVVAWVMAAKRAASDRWQ